MSRDELDDLIHLGSPFYSAEPWGRWSQGTRAIVFVNLDETVVRPARIVMKMMVLARSGPQHLAILINNKPTYTRTVTESGSIDVILDLTGEVHGATKIEVALSYASSPIEWGEADSRSLGIGVQSLELR